MFDVNMLHVGTTLTYIKHVIRNLPYSNPEIFSSVPVSTRALQRVLPSKFSLPIIVISSSSPVAGFLT